MRKILSILFLFCFFNAGAQPLGPDATISLLTCDEGTELYSLFGHSALRVEDPSSHLDIVCNWGVFEFGESEFDFAVKFAKGRLRYVLMLEEFQSFEFQYDYEKRGMRQQVLNLSAEQKRKMWELILENNMPENRAYRYDFFYDNCASRIRDLLEKVCGEDLQWHNHEDAGQLTFRNIIDKNLVTQPWSDVGIDLALGAKIDVNVTNRELMFLPEYMEEIFAQSKLNGRGLVASDSVLKEFPVVKSETSFIKRPGFVFWTVLLLGVAMLFFRLDLSSRIYDGFFFTAMGLAGVVVLLLWFATDHQGTKLNYNLLWANPIHFIIPVIMIFRKRRNGLNKLFLVFACFYFALFLFWFVLPQEYNPAFKPLILALGLRYYYWFRRTKSASVSA